MIERLAFYFLVFAAGGVFAMWLNSPIGYSAEDRSAMTALVASCDDWLCELEAAHRRAGR